MSAEIKRSVCPYDCPDTCGLLVEVENGKATRVTGDHEHPYTRGFLCPKGAPSSCRWSTCWPMR